MTDVPPPHIADLSAVNPDSITELFDRDPDLIAPVDLNRLIAEYRRRADTAKADAAAELAAPKSATGRKRKANPIIDAAMAALADKPVEEISLDDLGDV